jgi:hypothetical protein
LWSLPLTESRRGSSSVREGFTDERAHVNDSLTKPRNSSTWQPGDDRKSQRILSPHQGYAVAAALLDEVALAHWKTLPNPTEIINALRPGMATFPVGAACASSPYARKGSLWQAFQHWGRPDQCWSGVQTRVMNPTVSQAIIDAATGPAAAAANTVPSLERM